MYWLVLFTQVYSLHTLSLIANSLFCILPRITNDFTCVVLRSKEDVFLHNSLLLHMLTTTHPSSMYSVPSKFFVHHSNVTKTSFSAQSITSPPHMWFVSVFYCNMITSIYLFTYCYSREIELDFSITRWEDNLTNPLPALKPFKISKYCNAIPL